MNAADVESIPRRNPVNDAVAATTPRLVFRIERSNVEAAALDRLNARSRSAEFPRISTLIFLVANRHPSVCAFTKSTIAT
jgi:hypothetical protein